MKIEYYGTLLDQAGHGFYILNNGFDYNPRRFSDVPFNPENLPYAGPKKQYVDGIGKFYNCFGFTVCAIAGSPYDKRPGSKSIFFVEEELNPDNFKQILKENPTVMKIINKMPFEVKW